MAMKLTDINIKFIPGKRPVTTVKFDRKLAEIDLQYEARMDPATDVWVYRADEGDCVIAGAELKGKGSARVRMVDGYHTISGLMDTNSISVNMAFPDKDSAMDVWIDEDGVLIRGFVNAISFAKYLWSQGQPVALAVVEWPQGLRVHEPVYIDELTGPVLNRPGDKFIFVVMPEQVDTEG